MLKNLFPETAMGYEMSEQDEEYLNAVRELNYHIANTFLSPWHRISFIYYLTPTKRAQNRCAKIMKKFTTKVIEERRKMLSKIGNENLDNLDDNDVGLKKRMCFLDVLLQSTIDNMPLSNSDIQEEVDTFTFAGHDTTSTAISFILFAIAKHPEVQRKLNREIDEILGEDGELSFKLLNNFKYLEMVIKETLRMYPPVPIISRRSFEEVDLGDFIAPANANYNIGLYETLNDPKIFKNPQEFNPERFLENIPPFSFIPFSAGPRNCIGQKFAMTNIKSNIINIVRNFELIYGNVEPNLTIHITLKCDGINIGFRKKKLN
jgi:cytochrome P450 family 4